MDLGRPPRSAPPKEAFQSSQQGQQTQRSRPEPTEGSSFYSKGSGSSSSDNYHSAPSSGSAPPPVFSQTLSYNSSSTATGGGAGGSSSGGGGMGAGRVQFASEPSPSLYVADSSRANLLPPGAGMYDNDSSNRLTQTNSSGPSSTVNQSDFRRKKSLIRPDRERIDENHRLFNYRNHAAAMEAEGRGVSGVSRTGHFPASGLAHGLPPGAGLTSAGGNRTQLHDSSNTYGNGTGGMGWVNNNGVSALRRGKSILAREEGMATETGLSMFKRGATLRRPNNARGNDGESAALRSQDGGVYKEKGRLTKSQAASAAKNKPLGPWMIYCYALTVCCPGPFLKCFGLRTKDRQNAWREKIGLLGVIFLSMAFVGFLTFGFTKSVCGTPALRYKNGDIQTGSMIFHGYDYDMDKFSHPAAAGIAGGSNPLYDEFNTGGKDGSFLFQKVNENCLGVITPAPGSGIVNDGTKMGWYFPCNVYNQWGSTAQNKTGYAEGQLCHTPPDAREQFQQMKSLGQVYFDWSDLKNASRNLGVYDGAVLDFDLLDWLDETQVSFPEIFFDMGSGNNASYRGRDITSLMINSRQRAVAECLVDVIRVGFIDSVSIGCAASDVVLYVSLVVIIGVVVIRFFMAVIFGWFVSWKIGRFPNETLEQRRARAMEIENWTDDIYRPAPARYRPTVKMQKKSMLPKTSRFSKADLLGVTSPPPSSISGVSKRDPHWGNGAGAKLVSPKAAGMRNSPPASPGGIRSSRSSSSLPSRSPYNLDGHHNADYSLGACPFPPSDVVPQPPPDFEPFNYPLSHTILLVTAYSESFEGIRTTLDSLSTSDYPNSHKVILVIADGMVRGAGNKLTTPEIVLDMMKELVVPAEDVEALSYVAIADGHKRHNRAKVYAGFYKYDNNTVERSKQQRVPIMLIAKVGNAAEVNDNKPGNRGKRDSQIILMSFLQKVMFDERMTALEYEFFNSMWRCTGVSPDRYEMVLCVDADTKIFPDSVSRMVACMVHDPEIMGLCGETKIANKSETWVTMIQVFEYYVSHHLTKAFESMFGGVTCLPGCFSMYRIKSPKGGEGYWVPVLANPDIVEHYSENVVDTLHKKNLLLLGEDRYLSTLMLRTFPRRKMMFCPQAVCKTVVPDTFRVLLSQRRRWINSTVHNLFELFIVPDLCGVFCFSMRFVVFMELAGTLVLPAAIAFTLYLITVAIIPGTVKPTLSLILLAIILGIPAVLIVVTSRKIAYLGWMIIYLLSLPIWNFVLPAYAFLHMDDFSWGQTRKVAGDLKNGDTDADGDFDSSHIVMKRWADFERERRQRAGTQSRDSAYDRRREDSPQRSMSNRYSFISSTDTYISGPGGIGHDGSYSRGAPSYTEGGPQHQGPRHPSQLEFPAPLFTQGQSVSPASSLGSAIQLDRSTPDLPPKGVGELSPQLHSAPVFDYPHYVEAYDSDELETQGILGGQSPSSEQGAFVQSAPPRSLREQTLIYDETDSTASHPSTSGLSSQGSKDYAAIDNPAFMASRSDPFASPPPPPAKKPRGVSLVDDGPVPGSEGMRLVQRQKRSSSQQQPTAPLLSPPSSRSRLSLTTALSASESGVSSMTSPISGGGSLPPGAAPPRHSQLD